MVLRLGYGAADLDLALAWGLLAKKKKEDQKKQDKEISVLHSKSPSVFQLALITMTEKNFHGVQCFYASDAALQI